MAVGVWLPMGLLAAYFKLQVLPLSYCAGLARNLVGCAGLTTWMKRYCARRYGWR